MGACDVLGRNSVDRCSYELHGHSHALAVAAGSADVSRQLKVPVKQFCGPSNDAIWRAAGPFGSLTLVRKHKVGAGNFWWLTYFPKPTDFKSKREIFTQNLCACS